MSEGSNTSNTKYTNKNLSAKFDTQSILTHLPDSLARVIDQNGISVVKILDNIETDAIKIDVDVA